jgi:AraC-like DNA-binding protein
MAANTYREWSPPTAWRHVVSCLWEQRVISDFEHRVVPDGCADVIVGFGDPVAVGLADGPVVHRLAAGSSCRGLRLRAEAVATFFGMPAVEIRNLDVPLDDVVGSRRARRLVDAVLYGAPNPALTSTPPPLAQRALDLVGHSSVDEAAAALGLSSRQLRRVMLTNTGLGPKTYQRVARLRRFLADDRPLAEAAVSAGYADQPHLTREVTRLCGLAPAALRAERGIEVGQDSSSS